VRIPGRARATLVLLPLVILAWAAGGRLASPLGF
jgi:hypothetical protein